MCLEGGRTHTAIFGIFDLGSLMLRHLLSQVLESLGWGAMSLKWRRDVKAASPGSARGQAGSHRSLSEVSIGDRNLG